MNVRQTARNAWSILVATINEWLDDQAMRLAASLAFYTVLSLAPLMLVTIAVAGLFLGEDAARGHLSAELSGLVGHAGAKAIESILEHAESSSQGVLAAIFGAVVLLFGASAVFGELQETMNAIWEVAPRPGRGWRGLLRDRFVSFTMVLGVGFLLLVSLVASALMTAMASRLNEALGSTAYVAQFFHIVISLAITTGIFALMFKVVPDVEIGWRDVWLGGAITAVLFTIGKTLIGIYIGSSSVASSYGAAGSVVVLLVWVYYSAQVVFFGAELTQVLTRRLGRAIRPRKNAVPMPRAVPGTVAPGVAATEPCAPLVPHEPGAPELRAAIEESLRAREQSMRH